MSFSIRTKLFFITLFTVMITSIITITSMYIGNESISEEIMAESITASMNAIKDRTDDMKLLSGKMAAIIASDENLVNAIQTGSKQDVLNVVNELFKTINIGVEYATISNAEGVVIARTYSDKDGDSVAKQKNVNAALNGKSESYIESGSEIKMAVRSGAPVMSADGQLIGVVSTGYRLDIDSFVDNLKLVTGTEVTVFANDVRVATTLINNGERQVGTTLNERIAKIVLEQKQTHSEQTTIFGEKYFAEYTPILDDSGNVLGAFFAGQPLSHINAEKLKFTLYSIGFVLISCIILLVFISSLTKKMIVMPVVNMSRSAQQLSEGNLYLGNLSHRSKDEIGDLTNSIVEMSKIIQKLVTDLNEMANQHHLGNIDACIDTDKYVGSYKEMVGSVNHMLTEYITAERNTMDCVTDIVNGKFSAEMEQLPGKKVFINIAIDGLRSSLRNISSEVDNMIKNAVAGNLSARIDVTQYNGDWIKLMEGLNGVLAATASPIQESLSVIQEMAKGNFNITMTGNYNGDFDKIKTSVNTTVNNISGYIKEISTVLNEMAANNLDQEITREYIGEFANIKDSLNNIINQFNQIIKDIDSVSAQVAAGASAMSDTSMALATGATEQASSIEELTATVTTVSENTRMNADNSKKAEALSAQSKENAASGNKEMNDMLKSMQSIKDASNNISNIIKVIDNIAFQTNLLALNAAVEAARAGEHGKGFAVVASEVRNLASRSKTAASDTTALIENSIQKVNEGTAIATATAEALTKIVSNVTEVSSIISDISVASNEQADAISQINMGVTQIAEVVQNNSASSEEGASASQQLSSQSEVLRSMIQIFKLRK